MTPKFTYFHGGPGLSSFPDQALLGSVVNDFPISFWNEPSNIRPNYSDPFEVNHAFRNWMVSAENFILRQDLLGEGLQILIAHSFAALPILQIASRHEEKIAGVVLIAPTLDYHQSFRQAALSAHQDLNQVGSRVAPDLADALAQSRAPFDLEMIRALEFALSDNELIKSYWRQSKAMERWQAILVSDSRAQLDLHAWRAVLQDLYWENPHLELPQLSKPMVIISGAEDNVSDRASIEALVKAHPKAHWETWASCGHFPHLEESFDFGQMLYSLAQKPATLVS